MWLPAWWNREDRQRGQLVTVGLAQPYDLQQSWADAVEKYAIPGWGVNDPPNPILGHYLIMGPIVGSRGILRRAIEEYVRAGLRLGSLDEGDLLALENTDAPGKNWFPNIGKLLKNWNTEETILCSGCRPYHTLDRHIFPKGNRQTVTNIAPHIIKTHVEIYCNDCTKICEQQLIIETFR